MLVVVGWRVVLISGGAKASAPVGDGGCVDPRRMIAEGVQVPVGGQYVGLHERRSVRVRAGYGAEIERAAFYADPSTCC